MNKKSVILLVLAFILIGASIAFADYSAYLREAHRTFENYYAFRGCVQLIQKTDTYATCKLASGKIIKIVKYNNRWYLDGDLPTCWMGICL